MAVMHKRVSSPDMLQPTAAAAPAVLASSTKKTACGPTTATENPTARHRFRSHVLVPPES
jgi:hypothetical protein